MDKTTPFYRQYGLTILREFLIFTAICASCGFGSAKESYDASWRHIDSLIADGLTSTALDSTAALYATAKETQNGDQMVRTLMYRMRLESYREEDALAKAIERLAEEIQEAPFPASAILSSMLAECYRHYYNVNRWRFYERTRTVNFERGDIRTWDLRTITEAIAGNYSASLRDAARLKKINISSFGATIVNNPESIQRPTLYDLLCHRAIDYFSTGDNDLVRPSVEFRLDGAEYFAPFDKFMKLRITTEDTASLKYRAITLLRDCIAFHAADSSPAALVDADLRRIEFVREHTTHPSGDSLSLEALRLLRKRFSAHESSAEIACATAQLYRGQTNVFPSRSDNEQRRMNREAIAICESAIKEFPKSYGAELCGALCDEIRQKKLSFTIETVNVPDAPFKALVSYANVTKIYWRAVALSVDEWRKLLSDRNRDSSLTGLVSMKPAAAWENTLPDPGDYLLHTVETASPALSLGHYVVLCSSHPDFLCEKEILLYATVQISRIGFVSRAKKEGGQEFCLLDRVSGMPLAGAKVAAVANVYDESARDYKRKPVASYVADGDGLVTIPSCKEAIHEFFVICTKGNDRFDSDRSFYLYRYKKQEQSMRPRTFFFTDRSIYRPGQTIYFKAVMLSTDGDRSAILPDEKTSVTLRNVHGKEISRLDLVSNKYGTVHGSFIAPTGTLSGAMIISDNSGSATFYVEEYKRPNFSVTIQPHDENKKLGDSVYVRAKASFYTGAAVSGAQVRYRVVRTARFTQYWWRTCMPPFTSNETEIAGGNALTDDTGGVRIGFLALADNAASREDKPIFTYNVSIDVTDPAGETRSAVGSVSLGHTAATLTLDIAQMVSGDSMVVAVKSANCDGVFTPAAGSFAIYRLEPPGIVLRPRIWERPDTSVMTEKQYRSLFPHDPFGDEDDISTWKRGKRVFRTDFDTKRSTSVAIRDLRSWKQGVYVADGSFLDEHGDTITDVRYFTLYNPMKKRPLCSRADLFIPVKDTVEVNDTARFLIGSGYDRATVLCEVEHKGEIVRKEWLTLKNEQRLIEIPVKKEHRGGLTLHTVFMKDNRVYRTSAQVTVPWSDKKLSLSFATFRDKLFPSQPEQWKITVSGADGDKTAAEMVATLYDASLDAFSPHSWNFSIYPSHFGRLGWHHDDGFDLQGSMGCSHDWNVVRPRPERTYPQLNWFGGGFDDATPRYGHYGPYGAGYGSGFGETASFDAEATRPQSLQSPVARGPLKLAKAAPPAAKNFSVDAVRNGPSALKAGGVKKPGSKSSFDGSTNGVDNGFEQIATRSKLGETAFFFPALTTNEKGEVIINFTAPEALSTWKMLGFAHTKDLRFGFLTDSLVTRKELMITSSVPRFLRENDTVTLSAMVTNLSDGDLKGEARLFIFDAATMTPLDTACGNIRAVHSFNAGKGGGHAVSWSVTVPQSISAITVRFVARTPKFSDGEELTLPVLSDRMLVTETLPLHIRKKGKSSFTMRGLVSGNNGSKTLRNHRLTLEFTSNPLWYAVTALPGLMDYSLECSEQIFSGLYASCMASHIAASFPLMQHVFEQWKNISPGALLSNLEKNEHLKSIVLEETPWLLDGKDESERKRRIGLLFDLNTMADKKAGAFAQLEKMQLSNGGWPWFEGLNDDRLITQHIATGLGRMTLLGLIDMKEDGDRARMVRKAVEYLDERVKDDYRELVREGRTDEDNLGELQIHYLYMKSFFAAANQSRDKSATLDYYIGQAKKFFLRKKRPMQAMMAIALHRFGETATSEKIIRVLRENALHNEEMGMYWKEMYERASWGWFDAPIESQTLMAEVFDEVAKDRAAVDEILTWLLKSRQTQGWKTTRATVDACYALLSRGTGSIAEAPRFTIALGDTVIDPARHGDALPEAGSGYFSASWNGETIDTAMGNVIVTGTKDGVAWGALYWQYFERLDKITGHATPLALSKKLFVRKNSPAGPRIEPVPEKAVLKPGDRIVVRIELRVDRDMEYVHMKDMRAGGFEPLNVFSGRRYRDGLGYYESTTDAATNFFFDRLPKGVYVFEYPLSASHGGNFSNGITTIQCMYAPEFASHSEGVRVRIE